MVEWATFPSQKTFWTTFWHRKHSFYGSYALPLRSGNFNGDPRWMGITCSSKKMVNPINFQVGMAKYEFLANGERFIIYHIILELVGGFNPSEKYGKIKKCSKPPTREVFLIHLMFALHLSYAHCAADIICLRFFVHRGNCCDSSSFISEPVVIWPPGVLVVATKTGYSLQNKW